jgi:tape measure domain-containing protein
MAELYFKVASDWEEVKRLREECEKLESQLRRMDKGRTPEGVSALETQLGESKRRMSELVSEAAVAGSKLESDFKKKVYDASQGVNDLTERIIAQRDVIKNVERDVRRLAEEYRRLTPGTGPADSVLSNLNNAKKTMADEKTALFELTQQQAHARLSVKRLREEYALYKNEGKSVVDVSNQISISFKKAFAVIGGMAAIKSFASQVVKVRGEIQQLGISFETMLGSKEKADAMMAEVKRLAMNTPFTLTEVAGNTKQLIAMGIEADKVIDTMKALGDVAAGVSVPIARIAVNYGQVASLGKLQQREIKDFALAGIPIVDELAKMLGKTADEITKMVSAGEIGFPLVEQAFKNMSGEGGRFYNLMEKQNASVTGQISKLQDELEGMFNEIGQSSEGIIYGAIGATSELVANYEKVGKLILGMIATYGFYHSALLLITTATKGLTAALAAQKTVLSPVIKLFGLLKNAVSANPYVFLTSVVLGLVAAMWALHDSTSEEEKVQRRLSDLLESSKKKKDHLISATDDLTRRIKDETLTVYEQIRAWELLREKLPEVYAQMTYEQFRNLTDEQIKHMNATAADAREINEANRAYEEAIKVVAILRESMEYLVAAGDRSDYFYDISRDLKEAEVNAEAARKALDGVRKTQKEAEFQSKPAAERLAYHEEELKLLEEEKKRLEGVVNESNDLSGSWKGFNSEIYMTLARLGSVRDQIEKVNGDIGVLKADQRIQDYGTAYMNAKKEWEDAKKKLRIIEKDKDKFKVEQYESAKKREKETREIYGDLGGDTGGRTGGGNDAERIRREREKSNELRLRAEKSIADRDRELLRSREEEKLESEERLLDIEKEGLDKRMRQNALNYQKELLDIERREEEKRKKAEEYARDLYVKETGRDEGFDFAAFDADRLPEDLRPEAIRKWVEDAKGVAGEVLANANEMTLKEMMDQYKDYARQRMDVENRFNDDIAALIKLREQAEIDGDASRVEALNRAIAQATIDKGKALISFDFDLLRKNPDYVRAFEDLRDSSTETLTELLSQLEAVKGRASEVLNPEDLREYTGTIRSIIDELASRNPFEALTSAQGELTRSSKALEVAGKSLAKAQRDGDPSRLTQAQQEYLKALDDVEKANNRFRDAQERVNKKLAELYDSIKGVGGALGGQAGEIVNLIADVGSFVTTTVSGIRQAAVAGTTALATIEKASVILGIVQAAIRLMSQLDSLLPDAERQYERYARQIGEVNKLTDAVNDYRIAAMEARHEMNRWFSEDSLGALRDARILHEEVASAYFAKLYEEQAKYRNKSGQGWLDKIIASVIPMVSVEKSGGSTFVKTGALSDDLNMEKAINNLRVETRKASKGFLGSGIGGHSQRTEDLATWARNQGLGELFDKEGMINETLAKRILDNYNDKLVGETKETLEALVDLKEQYDAYLNDLQDYVSKLYSPLADNMVDSLWDWFDEGKDALDSFRDYASDTFRAIVSDMLRTIVLENITKGFSEDVKALYVEYSKGSLTGDALLAQVANLTRDLTGRYESQLPVLQDLMNMVRDEFGAAGIDLSKPEAGAGSENTLKGGYAKASQESVDLLAGQTGAQRVVLEEIKGMISEWMGRAREGDTFYVSFRDELRAIRDLQANGWRDVELIREFSRQVADHAGAIRVFSQDVAESNRSVATSAVRAASELSVITSAGVKLKGSGLGL